MWLWVNSKNYLIPIRYSIYQASYVIVGIKSSMVTQSGKGYYIFSRIQESTLRGVGRKSFQPVMVRLSGMDTYALRILNLVLEF